MNNSNRPTWPETWINFVELIAKRSCDPKTKVAAAIISADNTCVLSLGYNGPPHNFPHERLSLEDGKSGFIHAEQNCYYKLTYSDLREKILYTLFSPCYDCAMGAIQCRINRIVYKQPFRDISGIELIQKTNIEIYSLEQANILALADLWGTDSTKEARQQYLLKNA